MSESMEKLEQRQRELESAGAEALRSVADFGDQLAEAEAKLHARLDSEMLCVELWPPSC
eukprot:COSAG01_NODE_2665_length_7288_cov_30.045208_5_plen_59_part_00